MSSTVAERQHGSVCVGCGRSTHRFELIFATTEVPICAGCAERSGQHQAVILTKLREAFNAK